MAIDTSGPGATRSRAAIMQPYFLPYIGYYQLIAAADMFVIYDNIKYTKKGWINRNRFLLNGADAIFSIPLRHDSDALAVVERHIADDFEPVKLVRRLRAAYEHAPFFSANFPVIEEIIHFSSRNLFEYIANSVDKMCTWLGIGTVIKKASTIAIDRTLKAEDKVVTLCEALAASEYINLSGGLELYSREHFASHGIELRFIKSRAIQYAQFGGPFVPWLSIVDVLMFNRRQQVRDWVHHEFDLA
jgi:WbqC-like protein family